jgi:hypothetical protein
LLDILRPRSYDVETVAVTVPQASFVVLDERNVIVEVSPAARAGFGHLLGCDAFDSYPDTRALFLPHYQRARRTQRVVEFVQYYDRYVSHVVVVPDGNRLTVRWERLCMLDVLTLDGLRESLQVALDTLEAAEEILRRAEVRRSLRVVGGTR